MSNILNKLIMSNSAAEDAFNEQTNVKKLICTQVKHPIGFSAASNINLKYSQWCFPNRFEFCLNSINAHTERVFPSSYADDHIVAWSLAKHNLCTSIATISQPKRWVSQPFLDFERHDCVICCMSLDKGPHHLLRASTGLIGRLWNHSCALMRKKRTQEPRD